MSQIRSAAADGSQALRVAHALCAAVDGDVVRGPLSLLFVIWMGTARIAISSGGDGCQVRLFCNDRDECMYVCMYVS